MRDMEARAPSGASDGGEMDAVLGLADLDEPIEVEAEVLAELAAVAEAEAEAAAERAAESAAAIERDEVQALRRALTEQQQTTRAAVERYRAAALAAEPELPPELVQGETLAEVGVAGSSAAGGGTGARSAGGGGAHGACTARCARVSGGCTGARGRLGDRDDGDGEDRAWARGPCIAACWYARRHISGVSRARVCQVGVGGDVRRVQGVAARKGIRWRSRWLKEPSFPTTCCWRA